MRAMSTEPHHDLIFAHAGNARVAASVTLAGVIAVLIGGVSMAIGPRIPEDAGRSGTAETKTVRVIGTAPASTAPCAEQVWPHIDQRCLVRTDSPAPPAKPAAKEAKQAAQEPAKEDAKLTPLGATGNAVVGKEVTPQDEEIAARQAAVPQPRRETANWQARSDDPRFADDEDDVELDDVPPPPPRRVHRHFRLPFHGQIGPFRF